MPSMLRASRSDFPPTPFEELDGILPVHLGDRRTSFECVHWDARVLMAESPGLDFGHEWTHALSFRWGADIYASPAAYMAGAAYAKATDGIVLDCEEYRIFTPQRTVSGQSSSRCTGR